MARPAVLFSVLALSAASFFASCSTPKGVRATAGNPAMASHPADRSFAITLKVTDDPSLPTFKAEEISPSLANTLQKKFATMLQVAPKLIANTSLYSFIDSWFGTPYRFGGTGKNGIDCSAFVQQVYMHVFGTDLVRTAFQQFGSVKQLLSKDSLQEGDLVFFKTVKSRISHVGIYLANNHFVHSCSSKGVTVSSLDETYWARTYATAGRIL